MLGVFWLTTECNMQCVYCYEGHDKKKKYMESKTFECAIDFLLEQMKNQDDTRLNVEFHGGEPFLAYENMVRIVRRVKCVCLKNGISVRFGCTTNGTLLNTERLCFVQDEMQDFTISMDGEQQTQNYSRLLKSGKVTFELVEEWLCKTLKIVPDLRVRMTFNHVTVKHFFENIKYFDKLGVHYLVPTRDFFDNKFGEKEFSILKEQLTLAKEYIKTQGRGIHVSLLETFPVKKVGCCSGGIDSFHIDPQGDLYPCALSVGNKEFYIGSVYKGIDAKKRNDILSHSAEENLGCCGCGFYEYCEQTRCKIVNKILTGGYCRPSPIVCAENKMLIELA